MSQFITKYITNFSFWGTFTDHIQSENKSGIFQIIKAKAFTASDLNIKTGLEAKYKFVIWMVLTFLCPPSSGKFFVLRFLYH